MRLPFRSLATRLGIGAGLIFIVAAAASGLVVYGTSLSAERVATLLAAERRLELLSALSTQITTLAVVKLDEGAVADRSGARQDAKAPLIATIRNTFGNIREALGRTVSEAAELGIDEQSRRATRGIVLARMEATFEAFVADPPGEDAVATQARLNIFSTTFQPLLSSLITDERRARDQAFEELEGIRAWLNRMAAILIGAALALLCLFQFGLIRPLLRRIDRLRGAARQIGEEEFDVALPATQDDEVGLAFRELNQAANNLAIRKADVDAEWQRLNDTIAARTSELSAANAALAETDENRRRFFADISHEMRTPLTVITTEAELGLTAMPEQETAFSVILGRAQLLNRRIDDLLRIARSETGELAVNAAPFDLREAARLAEEETERAARRAGIRLVLDVREPITATGDANWTRQVIASLIDNAIRHAEGATDIVIALSQDGTTARASITDNGCGIPPDKAETVMTRFGQAGGQSASKGFGLGLAVARAVMEAQGGTLTLSSPAKRMGIDGGPGTMFTLTLPSAPKEDDG